MKYIIALSLFFLLTVSSKAQGIVDLKWNASPSTVSGYNAYHGTSIGGPYTKINTTLISGLAYTDSSAITGLNTYVITSVDSNNLESVFSNEATATVAGQTPPPPPPPPTGSILINNGGPAYTDMSGSTWSADKGCSSGSTFTTTHAITGTVDPKLYQTERWGVFTCTYTVTPGTYAVTLKFAESSFSKAGQRVFNVSINGTNVLTNFDIVGSAGGEYIAVDRTFNITATNSVAIQFIKGTADQPKIDAISIVPTSVTPPPPPQGMTTICSFTSATVWTCNSTLENIPSGQAIKSVTSTGTVTNTTNGTKP